MPDIAENYVHTCVCTCCLKIKHAALSWVAPFSSLGSRLPAINRLCGLSKPHVGAYAAWAKIHCGEYGLYLALVCTAWGNDALSVFSQGMRQLTNSHKGRSMPRIGTIINPKRAPLQDMTTIYPPLRVHTAQQHPPGPSQQIYIHKHNHIPSVRWVLHPNQ